jgi:hypothetical protein
MWWCFEFENMHVLRFDFIFHTLTHFPLQSLIVSFQMHRFCIMYRRGRRRKRLRRWKVATFYQFLLHNQMSLGTILEAFIAIFDEDLDTLSNHKIDLFLKLVVSVKNWTYSRWWYYCQYRTDQSVIRRSVETVPKPIGTLFDPPRSLSVNARQYWKRYGGIRWIHISCLSTWETIPSGSANFADVVRNSVLRVPRALKAEWIAVGKPR